MDPETLPLRDVHLPEPISWWPPAYGWWAILITAMILVALLVWWRRRARRLSVVYTRELKRIEAAHRGHGDGSRLAAELSVLLRRACITAVPGRGAAGLTGPAWLDFLDRIHGARLFNTAAGRVLLEAPYRPSMSVDAAALVALCARLGSGLDRAAERV